MKHKALKALVLLFCLSSCDSLQEHLIELPSNEELIPLQFSIDLRQEVLPFPSTKSIPDLDIPEPSALPKGGEPDPSVPQDNSDMLYKQIDYLVYRKGNPNTLVKHKSYQLDDPDFSIIYDSLPRGEYQFCFLAHSDNTISIQGETAEFKKVSDTFHLYQYQAIKAGEKLVKDVTLKRIVSKIEFVATDTVTTDLKTFTMEVEGFQNKIDLTTGLGISENTPFSDTYSFQEGDFGKVNFSHSFLTFVSTDGSPLTANLKATNKLGENTRIRKITEIKPQQNFIIRYSGFLYIPPKSNDTFTIDIYQNGKWEDTINHGLIE